MKFSTCSFDLISRCSPTGMAGRSQRQLAEEFWAIDRKTIAKIGRPGDRRVDDSRR